MPHPASSKRARETRRHPPIEGSGGDSRHGSDRRRPSRSARQADGMDRRPQSRAPDTRHHDVASDAGGRRAAAIYSLIASAKLNGLNPQHYFADLLARIADHPARQIADLLPWHWKPVELERAAA